MSINIWIDNLTNFLTLFTKKLFSIFSMQQLHENYAIWEIYFFMPFGNYAIWDVIMNIYPKILRIQNTFCEVMVCWNQKMRNLTFFSTPLKKIEILIKMI